MNIEKELTVLEILTKLVSFNTVSSESNLALIDWVDSYLGQYGVNIQRIDELEGKASLVARIGPDTEGGIVFSGHTDVVPVEGQPWSQDPFTLWQDNDKYYGRGTCDMKGFIACVLSQVPKWANLNLSKPIYIALTRDEEIGCLGAKGMASFLETNSLTKPLIVVGEPTSMQPVVAQKGITSFKTVVYGQAAHSSQVYQGVSAVHVASRLVYEIEKIMQDLVDEGEVDHNFNVPISSLHVGTISGGSAINVKARECSFEWEVRHLPNQKLESIMARVDRIVELLKKEYPKLEVETKKLSPTVPALADRNNKNVLQVISKYLPENIETKYVSYATEAGTFQEYEFETVILGPGSIEQAHQPDEWIEIAQIRQCNDFLAALVEGYCI